MGKSFQEYKGCAKHLYKANNGFKEMTENYKTLAISFLIGVIIGYFVGWFVGLAVFIVSLSVLKEKASKTKRLNNKQKISLGIFGVAIIILALPELLNLSMGVVITYLIEVMLLVALNLVDNIK